MHWHVRTNNDTSSVKIAPGTSANHPTTVSCGSQNSKLQWHTPSSTLQVIDENDVEHNLAIRSLKLNHDSDAGSYQLAFYYRTPYRGEGQLICSCQAQLTRFAPGLEQRQAAQKKRGAVLRAPITGKVLSVDVSEGDSVVAGQTLLVIEAMKMENKIKAPMDGVITDLTITSGAQAKTNQPLLTVKPQD